MNYIDLLYDVVKKDIEYGELADKAVEKYLDSINYNPEIKTVIARDIDGLDQKDFIESNGYKLKEITYFKKDGIGVMIFEKLEPGKMSEEGKIYNFDRSVGSG
jgi:hypothetical protein